MGSNMNCCCSVLKPSMSRRVCSQPGKCFWLKSGWAMRGEAALAFALADVVALSTGTCRQEQDREGNGSGPCTALASTVSWATGLGQSSSGRELEDRRPQQWKDETVYRRWETCRGQGHQGGRILERGAHTWPLEPMGLVSVTDPLIPRQF